jgi:hypothetical protein
MPVVLKVPPIISTTGFCTDKTEIIVNEDCNILQVLYDRFRLKLSDYYLVKCAESVFNVKLRIVGGKGGFGSQLRAQGNKMSSKKRAGNYESCRSLNGQRIRVQKQTKMIEEYLAREPERLSKKEQEIREKMQKYLDAPDKKVMFCDPEYLKLSRKLLDGTEDAVRLGTRTLEEESDSEDSESDDSEDGDEKSTGKEIVSEDDEKAPLNSTIKRNHLNLDKYLNK